MQGMGIIHHMELGWLVDPARRRRPAVDARRSRRSRSRRRPRPAARAAAIRSTASRRSTDLPLGAPLSTRASRRHRRRARLLAPRDARPLHGRGGPRRPRAPAAGAVDAPSRGPLFRRDLVFDAHERAAGGLVVGVRQTDLDWNARGARRARARALRAPSRARGARRRRPLAGQPARRSHGARARAARRTRSPTAAWTRPRRAPRAARRHGPRARRGRRDHATARRRAERARRWRDALVMLPPALVQCRAAHPGRLAREGPRDAAPSRAHRAARLLLHVAARRRARAHPRRARRRQGRTVSASAPAPPRPSSPLGRARRRRARARTARLRRVRRPADLDRAHAAARSTSCPAWRRAGVIPASTGRTTTPATRSRSTPSARPARSSRRSRSSTPGARPRGHRVGPCARNERRSCIYHRRHRRQPPLAIEGADRPRDRARRAPLRPAHRARVSLHLSRTAPTTPRRCSSIRTPRSTYVVTKSIMSLGDAYRVELERRARARTRRARGVAVADVGLRRAGHRGERPPERDARAAAHVCRPCGSFGCRARRALADVLRSGVPRLVPSRGCCRVKR